MDASSTGGFVLIVDDDQDVRRLLRSHLELEGYQVAEAENGCAALERLRADPTPFLIILDLVMPVTDGWTFCEHRHLDPRIRAIPVALLSGQAGPSRQAPYVGISAALTKPVDLAELMSVVRRHAERG